MYIGLREGYHYLKEEGKTAAILGLARIDRFQADVIRGLSCIAKYRFPIKLGMTGDELSSEIYESIQSLKALTFSRLTIISSVNSLFNSSFRRLFK